MITAQHVANWDEPHARAVGVLLASLHSIGEQRPESEKKEFGSYEDRYLVEAAAGLAVTVDLGVISAEQTLLIDLDSFAVCLRPVYAPRRGPAYSLRRGLVHDNVHARRAYAWTMFPIRSVRCSTSPRSRPSGGQ